MPPKSLFLFFSPVLLRINLGMDDPGCCTVYNSAVVIQKLDPVLAKLQALWLRNMLKRDPATV